MENEQAQCRRASEAIDSLGGRYIVAEDVGTSAADMLAVRAQTRYVAGIAPSMAVAASLHPLRHTAVMSVSWPQRAGRFVGMIFCVRVLVQGLGSVGFRLCRYLHEAGARLTVTDLDHSGYANAEADFGARVLAWMIFRCRWRISCRRTRSAACSTMPASSDCASRRHAGGATHQLADAASALVQRSSPEHPYAPDGGSIPAA